MYKKIIRGKAEGIRNSISREEKAALDNRIYTHLFSWEIYKNAHYLFCYVSFRTEVDTIPIIKHALSENKTVSVPRIFPRTKEMKAFVIEQIEGCLYTGNYGILEPVEQCHEASYEKIELIITPGLAFSIKGERIGYGGGYYDRFLEKNTKSAACALTYDSLILNYLPVKKNDRAVDYLITESGVKKSEKKKNVR